MTHDNDDVLILETTRGAVTIAMRPDLAPRHVARIKELVREGFYNGIVFHRVIDGMENVDGIKRGEPVANPDKIVSAKMKSDAG